MWRNELFQNMKVEEPQRVRDRHKLGGRVMETKAGYDFIQQLFCRRTQPKPCRHVVSVAVFT